MTDPRVPASSEPRPDCPKCGKSLTGPWHMRYCEPEPHESERIAEFAARGSSEPRPEVRDCPLMHGAAPCPMCAYCPHGLTAGRGADERCLECGAAVTEPRPENPYRADQDVPLGAPSAEEFARRRGDVVQCSRCGQFSPPVPVTDDVAAAWVEAECENERLRAERDEALAALEKIADDERERIVAKLRFFGFPAAATMVEGDA